MDEKKRTKNTMEEGSDQSGSDASYSGSSNNSENESINSGDEAEDQKPALDGDLSMDEDEEAEERDEQDDDEDQDISGSQEKRPQEDDMEEGSERSVSQASGSGRSNVSENESANSEDEVEDKKPVLDADLSMDEDEEEQEAEERDEQDDDEDRDISGSQEKKPQEEEMDDGDDRSVSQASGSGRSNNSENESANSEGEVEDRKPAVDADDILADLAMDDDEEDQESEEKEEREIRGFQDEEEQPEEEIPITRIEVEIPKIPNELGKDIHFVKLPNFLSVDTHPYDPSWYEDEIDEDEILDEEGRHRLKLKVESTIRWRTVVDENGESQRESNARVVKWSDGSMSLHLGSEIFDIHKQSLMAGDNNHLFIRQGTGLQGQAVFKSKLTFRPHSTDSFTHRKMTLSLAERSHKTQKIRVLPNVGKDPEAHRSEMIKKEEDKLKASIRRENKQRRVREKAPFRGPTASYLEPDAYDEEDEDGGVSLSAIKKRYKKGGAGYNIYTDSEDESDLDIEKKKGPSERKRTSKIVVSDDEDE